MQSSLTHIPTSDFQEGIFPVSSLEARPSVAELPFFNTALYAETRFSLRVGNWCQNRGIPIFLGVLARLFIFWKKATRRQFAGTGASIRYAESKKIKKSLRRRRKASLVCACKRNIM